MIVNDQPTLQVRLSVTDDGTTQVDSVSRDFHWSDSCGVALARTSVAAKRQGSAIECRGDIAGSLAVRALNLWRRSDATWDTFRHDASLNWMGSPASREAALFEFARARAEDRRARSRLRAILEKCYVGRTRADNVSAVENLNLLARAILDAVDGLESSCPERNQAIELLHVAHAEGTLRHLTTVRDIADECELSRDYIRRLRVELFGKRGESEPNKPERKVLGEAREQLESDLYEADDVIEMVEIVAAFVGEKAAMAA